MFSRRKHRPPPPPPHPLTLAGGAGRPSSGNTSTTTTSAHQQQSNNALLAATQAFEKGHGQQQSALSASAAAAALKHFASLPPNPTTIPGQIPTKRMLERQGSYSGSLSGRSSSLSNGTGGVGRREISGRGRGMGVGDAGGAGGASAGGGVGLGLGLGRKASSGSMTDRRFRKGAGKNKEISEPLPVPAPPVMRNMERDRPSSRPSSHGTQHSQSPVHNHQYHSHEPIPPVPPVPQAPPPPPHLYHHRGHEDGHLPPTRTRSARGYHPAQHHQQQQQEQVPVTPLPDHRTSRGQLKAMPRSPSPPPPPPPSTSQTAIASSTRPLSPVSSQSPSPRLQQSRRDLRQKHYYSGGMYYKHFPHESESSLSSSDDEDDIHHRHALYDGDHELLDEEDDDSISNISPTTPRPPRRRQPHAYPQAVPPPQSAPDTQPAKPPTIYRHLRTDTSTPAHPTAGTFHSRHPPPAPTPPTSAMRQTFPEETRRRRRPPRTTRMDIVDTSLPTPSASSPESVRVEAVRPTPSMRTKQSTGLVGGRQTVGLVSPPDSISPPPPPSQISQQQYPPRKEIVEELGTPSPPMGGRTKRGVPGSRMMGAEGYSRRERERVRRQKVAGGEDAGFLSKGTLRSTAKPPLGEELSASDGDDKGVGGNGALKAARLAAGVTDELNMRKEKAPTSRAMTERIDEVESLPSLPPAPAPLQSRKTFVEDVDYDDDDQYDDYDHDEYPHNPSPPLPPPPNTSSAVYPATTSYPSASPLPTTTTFRSKRKIRWVAYNSDGEAIGSEEFTDDGEEGDLLSLKDVSRYDERRWKDKDREYHRRKYYSDRERGMNYVVYSDEEDPIAQPQGEPREEEDDGGERGTGLGIVVEEGEERMEEADRRHIDDFNEAGQDEEEFTGRGAVGVGAESPSLLMSIPEEQEKEIPFVREERQMASSSPSSLEELHYDESESSEASPSYQQRRRRKRKLKGTKVKTTRGKDIQPKSSSPLSPPKLNLPDPPPHEPSSQSFSPPQISLTPSTPQPQDEDQSPPIQPPQPNGASSGGHGVVDLDRTTTTPSPTSPTGAVRMQFLRVLSNPDIPTKKHDPPPRSVSPAKSAMKKTTVSPSSPVDTIAGNRVSFSEESVVVGSAEEDEDDDDDRVGGGIGGEGSVLGPRPKLPEIKSLRKREGGVGDHEGDGEDEDSGKEDKGGVKGKGKGGITGWLSGLKKGKGKKERKEKKGEDRQSHDEKQLEHVEEKEKPVSPAEQREVTQDNGTISLNEAIYRQRKAREAAAKARGEKVKAQQQKKQQQQQLDPKAPLPPVVTSAEPLSLSSDSELSCDEHDERVVVTLNSPASPPPATAITPAPGPLPTPSHPSVDGTKYLAHIPGGWVESNPNTPPPPTSSTPISEMLNIPGQQRENTSMAVPQPGEESDDGEKSSISGLSVYEDAAEEIVKTPRNSPPPVTQQTAVQMQTLQAPSHTNRDKANAVAQSTKPKATAPAPSPAIAKSVPTPSAALVSAPQVPSKSIKRSLSNRDPPRPTDVPIAAKIKRPLSALPTTTTPTSQQQPMTSVLKKPSLRRQRDTTPTTTVNTTPYSSSPPPPRRRNAVSVSPPPPSTTVERGMGKGHYTLPAAAITPRTQALIAERKRQMRMRRRRLGLEKGGVGVGSSTDEEDSDDEEYDSESQEEGGAMRRGWVRRDGSAVNGKRKGGDTIGGLAARSGSLREGNNTKRAQGTLGGEGNTLANNSHARLKKHITPAPLGTGTGSSGITSPPPPAGGGPGRMLARTTFRDSNPASTTATSTSLSHPPPSRPHSVGSFFKLPHHHTPHKSKSLTLRSPSSKPHKSRIPHSSSSSDDDTTHPNRRQERFVSRYADSSSSDDGGDDERKRLEKEKEREVERLIGVLAKRKQAAAVAAVDMHGSGRGRMETVEEVEEGGSSVAGGRGVVKSGRTEQGRDKGAEGNGVATVERGKQVIEQAKEKGVGSGGGWSGMFGRKKGEEVGNGVGHASLRKKKSGAGSVGRSKEVGGEKGTEKGGSRFKRMFGLGGKK